MADVNVVNPFYVTPYSKYLRLLAQVNNSGLNGLSNLEKLTMSTGLVTGGELSINGTDNTTFDVTAGTGYIIDAYTNPLNATVFNVQWDNIVGHSVTNLGTENVTYVMLDRNGHVYQTNDFPTPAERRDNIFLHFITIFFISPSPSSIM